jgi:hypothetical protein
MPYKGERITSHSQWPKDEYEGGGRLFDEEEPPCPHPIKRQYAWIAYDGIVCIGCCACGIILKGASDAE